MNELHDYIKKVMWYAYMEYDVPVVSIEEFEQSSILLSHVMDFYLSKSPFQNCACSLVEYMKQHSG